MEVMWMMSNHDIGICHRDLEWRDIKCGHIILTAPLILIVDNVFPNVVIGIWIFDLSFPPTIVYDKY